MQIQLNYSDWQHASGRNVNADYLYEQVSSKNIPVVVMEPLLGGRLSNIPDHIFSRLKETQSRRQCGIVGLPLCRYTGKGAHRT